MVVYSMSHIRAAFMFSVPGMIIFGTSHGTVVGADLTVKQVRKCYDNMLC